MRDNELHDFSLATASTHGKSCNRYGQPEAPRTSAARVDKENVAPLLGHGLVGVTGHDGAEARGIRIDGEFRQIVKDVYQVTADLDDVVCWKVASPAALVVVTAYRVNRRDRLERAQDGRVTDVATVNDEVRVPERLDRLRPNQAMGI